MDFLRPILPRVQLAVTVALGRGVKPVKTQLPLEFSSHHQNSDGATLVRHSVLS